MNKVYSIVARYKEWYVVIERSADSRLELWRKAEQGERGTKLDGIELVPMRKTYAESLLKSP